MIIILKPNVTDQEVNDLILKIKNEYPVDIHLSKGHNTTIVGLVGDTTQIDMENLVLNKIVDSVKRIQEPYKKANRKMHTDDTVINVGGNLIGGNYFQVIAGPCAVESEEQLLTTAKAVKAAGANFLRGGAFKPRTSPYAFQGLKADGIELLKKARALTRQPIVTEITNIMHLPLFDDIDVIQVGTRNMQNFELLKELGHCNKPILLKRGMSSTIEELLMSAEYIMSGGNEQIILCERGIRTFETALRNTLDLSAVSFLKRITHLPVFVDPSHATGKRELIAPMAKAAVAAGADGLLIEVHNDPAHALCDGPQSLTCEDFAILMQSLSQYAKLENKIMQ